MNISSCHMDMWGKKFKGLANAKTNSVGLRIYATVSDKEMSQIEADWLKTCNFALETQRIGFGIVIRASTHV